MTPGTAPTDRTTTRDEVDLGRVRVGSRRTASGVTPPLPPTSVNTKDLVEVLLQIVNLYNSQNLSQIRTSTRVGHSLHLRS